MDFKSAVIQGFKKYFDFTTSSSRSEFWYWMLFNLLAAILINFLGLVILESTNERSISRVIEAIPTAMLIIPTLSVTFRRFHDIGRSGWWSLIQFTIIGIIPMYIWLTFPSKLNRQESIYLPRTLKKCLVSIVPLFWTAYFVALEPYKMVSGSMLPAIQIGDHLFATMHIGNVNRRDIVVFPYPKNPSVDYIKRAIGLPGETLEIRNDKVFIDGKELDEPYAFFDRPKGQSDQPQSFSDGPVSNFGPVQIPEGKLFVMGDNRYNSADSRYWGFIDVDEVFRKGQIVYWSHDPRESLTSGYQFSRILTLLK